MAAITPIYDYDFTILHNVVTEASWRQLLFWLGPPGLVVAALALLTLDEPRAPGSAPSGDPFASSKFINPATRAMSRSRGDRFVEKGAEAWAKSGRKLIGGASVSVAPAAAAALPSSSLSLSSSSTDPKPSVWESVKALCSSRAFQAITAAAAINDVGSWSLVAFQATFYQRVYDLGPETYAPALAIILPIGGILGGVGGGLLADGKREEERERGIVFSFFSLSRGGNDNSPFLLLLSFSLVLSSPLHSNRPVPQRGTLPPHQRRHPHRGPRPGLQRPGARPPSVVCRLTRRLWFVRNVARPRRGDGQGCLPAGPGVDGVRRAPVRSELGRGAGAVG